MSEIKRLLIHLKSNMDRFIDQSPNKNDYGGQDLKSNMDRFIALLD